MFCSNHCRRAIVLLLILSCIACSARSGEDFSRTRHKAALLVLLCYNPVSRLQKDFSCQRAQLIGLCNMFVQEGGYVSSRAQGILDITDPEVEHVAMLVRELSGDVAKISRPGPMLLASAVSLGYARPEVSGLRAAMHLGRMSSADPQTDAVTRAVYSLLTNILEDGIDDKNDLLKIAAVNADEKEVARELRGLRLREWRKLPDEKTLLGRMCRALYIWQHTSNWKQAMSMGKRKLRYFESLRFLAVVCAAWGDMPGMPEDFVWRSLQEGQVRQLCIRLHELARTGVLIYIPKSLVDKQFSPSRSYSRESLNGQPADSLQARGTEGEMAPLPQIASPALPGKLTLPAEPAAPAAIPAVFDEDSVTLPAVSLPQAPAAPPALLPVRHPVTPTSAPPARAADYSPPEAPEYPQAPVLAPVDEFSSFALPSN